MVEFPNFYENLQEAQSRLVQTVVCYDDEPYHVLAITNHKPDGIFRVYLKPLAEYEKTKPHPLGNYPPWENYHPNDTQMGPAIDQYIENDPKGKTILRKHMNSPAFKKYRPFPLGMCNTGENGNGRCYYLERQPQRPSMHQGLSNGMIDQTLISLGGDNSPRKFGGGPPLYSQAMRDCIVGVYPTAQEVLERLKSGTIINEAVAFHREFALVKGPIGMLFLVYKTDVVGVLPRGNFSEVRIGKEFAHTREVIDELNIFQSMTM